MVRTYIDGLGFDGVGLSFGRVQRVVDVAPRRCRSRDFCCPALATPLVFLVLLLLWCTLGAVVHHHLLRLMPIWCIRKTGWRQRIGVGVGGLGVGVGW